MCYSFTGLLLFQKNTAVWHKTNFLKFVFRNIGAKKRTEQFMHPVKVQGIQGSGRQPECWANWQMSSI